MIKLNKVKSGSLVKYEILVNGEITGYVRKNNNGWFSYKTLSDTNNRYYSSTQKGAIEKFLGADQT